MEISPIDNALQIVEKELDNKKRKIILPNKAIIKRKNINKYKLINLTYISNSESLQKIKNLKKEERIKYKNKFVDNIVIENKRIEEIKGNYIGFCIKFEKIGNYLIFLTPIGYLIENEIAFLFHSIESSFKIYTNVDDVNKEKCYSIKGMDEENKIKIIKKMKKGIKINIYENDGNDDDEDDGKIEIVDVLVRDFNFVKIKYMFDENYIYNIEKEEEIEEKREDESVNKIEEEKEEVKNTKQKFNFAKAMKGIAINEPSSKKEDETKEEENKKEEKEKDEKTKGKKKKEEKKKKPFDFTKALGGI